MASILLLSIENYLIFKSDGGVALVALRLVFDELADVVQMSTPELIFLLLEFQLLLGWRACINKHCYMAEIGPCRSCSCHTLPMCIFL